MKEPAFLDDFCCPSPVFVRQALQQLWSETRLYSSDRSHNGIKKRLKQLWKLLDLRFAHGLLLPIFVCLEQCITFQCVVDVLQVQVGHKLRRHVDGY